MFEQGVDTPNQLRKGEHWESDLPVEVATQSEYPDKTVDKMKGRSAEFWLNPELRQHEATANLDDQLPATLYYLGLVKDIPQVVEVYVEELNQGRRKHWTVLSERDYEVMDEIYEIEEDTIQRFPASGLGFRVTVTSERGPSVSRRATKIYETT